MKKNYYDILQINQNASPEIIEKAYKVLAKKYHPDLQKDEDKENAEKLLKEINEAYEILSNPIKRSNYDKSLEISSVPKEEYDKIYKQNQILKNELNNIRKTNINANYNYQSNQIPQNINNNSLKKQIEIRKQENIINQQSQQNNNKITKKQKTKYRFNNFIKTIISLILTIIILLLLWNIPFIHNFFMDLYNENELLQNLINIFQR